MGCVLAGRGHVLVHTEGREAAKLIRGSAERRVEIDRKPFVRLIFAAADRQNYSELESLSTRHSNRDIRTGQSDANSYLQQLHMDW